jgi:tripartite-type tricarboxylate transporter receptor subunit TctC
MILGCFCCFLVSIVPIASGAEYPTKPIEIAVGYASGAFTDVATRMIFENSKKYLGQEAIIYNKPGGGGRVAMTLVSKAKPDGYTIGTSTDSGVTLLPFLEKVPYKPLEDFTFISQIGSLHNGIIVLTDSPFRSFKDLIEFAKANPGKLTVGTPGVGTSPYIAFEAISFLEGIKINIVPFTTGHIGLTNLMGGHIMANSSAGSGWSAQVRAKKVRLLAVMSDERISEYPEVPTLKELGYPIVFQSLTIMFGPPNMDKAIVNKLVEFIKKMIDSPEYIKYAKSVDNWAEKTLHGEALKAVIVERSKKNEDLLKKLGMAIK